MHYIVYLTCWLVGWLCLMSDRQRGHLEMIPPFTVPCEGCEARFLHSTRRESNPRPSCSSPLHNRCATLAPYLSCILSLVLD